MSHRPDPPFVVTLGFDPPTFERLDALRARYFPPERNQIPAHVSLFHHLPGDEFDAIDAALDRASRSTGPIPLGFDSIRRMGRGLMLPVDAPGLLPVRAGLARAFDRWLTDQDRQPFRPHVTVMNKADRDEVDAALSDLQSRWSPWSGHGRALCLWRYLGGPWESVADYEFRGPASEAT